MDYEQVVWVVTVGWDERVTGVYTTVEAAIRQLQLDREDPDAPIPVEELLPVVLNTPMQHPDELPKTPVPADYRVWYEDYPVHCEITNQYDNVIRGWPSIIELTSTIQVAGASLIVHRYHLQSGAFDQPGWEFIRYPDASYDKHRNRTNPSRAWVNERVDQMNEVIGFDGRLWLRARPRPERANWMVGDHPWVDEDDDDAGAAEDQANADID